MLRPNVPICHLQHRKKDGGIEKKILACAQKELLFLRCLLKFVTLSWFFMKVLSLG